MFAKNSLVGVMAVVIGLATTVGCSKSSEWRAMAPKDNKQKAVDTKTKKAFVGSQWYFDFAVQSFSDPKMKDLGSVRESDHQDFNSDVSENGRNIFPKTLSFTSEKDVTINDGSGDKTEATYTIVNGSIELKTKDAKDSVKEAKRGYIEFMGSSQMTWTSENPAAKSKIVFVFKRSK